MQDSVWAFLIQRSVDELRPRARRYGEIADFVFDEARPVEAKSQPNNRVDVSFGLLVMPMQVSLPEITAADLDNDMPLSDANVQSVWRQIGKSYFAFIARRDLQNQCFLHNLEACAQRSDLNEIDLPSFAGNDYALAIDWWRTWALSKDFDRLEQAYSHSRIRHHHRPKNK